MFNECNNLINLDLSSFNTNNVANLYGIFHGCHRRMIDTNISLFKKFSDKDLIK